MTVRRTVRAATDRGPQAESRVLFEAPMNTNPNLLLFSNAFGFVFLYLIKDSGSNCSLLFVSKFLDYFDLHI